MTTRTVAPRGRIDRFFDLTSRRTTIAREVRGGVG